jgi:hypothetical protein
MKARERGVGLECAYVGTFCGRDGSLFSSRNLAILRCTSFADFACSLYSIRSVPFVSTSREC